MRIFYLAAIAGVLLLCGCSRESDDPYARIQKLRMRQFAKTEVVFPEGLIAKSYDGREPDTTLLARNVKMVAYFDNKGCESCDLQALAPISIFTLENRKYDNFGAVIIMSPSSVEETDNILRDMNFRGTVFFDMDGSFSRANPLMSETIFLLNDKNHVVYAGAPTKGSEMEKKYQRAIKKYNNSR